MMPHDILRKLLSHIPEATIGIMFGYPCLKFGRKPFVFYSIHQEGALAFKLGGAQREFALDLDGARLFDPKGEDKPMRNWVELPAEQNALFPELALYALEFLQSQ